MNLATYSDGSRPIAQELILYLQSMSSGICQIRITEAASDAEIAQVILAAAKASAPTGFAVKDVYIEFSTDARGPDYAIKVTNESATRRLLDKAKSKFLFVTYEALHRAATAADGTDIEGINFFFR